jgi:ketosteroid isomerase-like protein
MFERVQVVSNACTDRNSTPYKELWSHMRDITIFGAWGDYEVGWDEVGPCLDWTAARFPEGELKHELLAMGASGDLAYTIAIERGIVRLAGQAEPARIAMRVTHIYRREAGEWKVIHRHADPIMGKTETAAVADRGRVCVKRVPPFAKEPEIGRTEKVHQRRWANER